MGCSYYIGRVGALAVALGVGFAVGSPAGTGWAETTDAAGPSAGSDISSTEAGAQAAVDTTTNEGGSPETQGSPDGPADGTDTAPSAEPESTSSPTEQTVEVAPGVVVSSSGGAQTSDEEEPDGHDGPDGTRSTTTGSDGRDPTAEGTKSVTAPSTQTSAQTVRTNSIAQDSTIASNTAATAMAVDTDAAATVIFTAPPAPQVSTQRVVANPVTTINPIVKAFLAPILAKIIGAVPGVPANSPLGWLLLAATRREIGVPTTAPTTSTTPSPTLMSLTATTDLAPTVQVTFGTPTSVTGTVTGQVSATDPEGGTLTYAVTTPPSSGTLVFDSTTKKITYTPTTAQRILAATTTTVIDTIPITLTVSDGVNSVATVVNVPVSEAPLNKLAEISSADGYSVAVAGTKAYVTNKTAGTVTVIDTVTNTVVKTIAVGANPDNVVVNASGTKLFVSSSESNTLKVVNASTGAIAKTINVAKPSAMALNSSGSTLYVASLGAGTVVKVNTSWYSTSTLKLPTGSRPTDIIVSPDKTKIYVAGTTATGGGMVAVIGYTSSSGTTLANLSGAPTALAISADNKRLFVTTADNKLTVLDTGTRAVVATRTLSGVPAGIALSKDGSTVLVTDTAGVVSAQNTVTGALLGTFATRTSTTPMSTPPGTALSPDGTRLYITDYDADKAYVVSLIPPNTAPAAGTPVLNPPNTTTGAVSGKVGATDPDGDALKYTLVTKPAKGTLSMTADGSFTYTPTSKARHAAAATGAGPSLSTDTFTVTVADGRGGTITTAVTVNILPANKVPVVKVTQYAPSTTTGAVKGVVSSTDGDYDVRTYTATTAPTKGTLVVTSTNGYFTYTPTAQARHAAAKVGATAVEKTDTFAVTVDDGHGGKVIATVTVPISPTNAKPTTPTVSSTTNWNTGLVTGTVKSTDADNDTLTFTSTPATKGQITMQTNGSFTYEPTLAARQAAALPGATTATKTDIVTVTVVDGYGGTATTTLTLNVAPALSTSGPTNGGYQAGDPTMAIGTVTGKVTATDPQNDALTYTVTTKPTRGLVQINATTGAFTYVPNVDARYAAHATPGLDTDTFTVNVADGNGGSTSLSVTVQVAPPLAGAMDQRSTTVAVNVQELHFLNATDTGKAMDLLKEAGVTNIRILVPWASTEFTNDVFSWGAIDRVVNAAVARDIEVLAVLNSTPLWAAYPNMPPLSGYPTDVNEFAEYAGMVATRYKGKISAYEVWNEPNFIKFWAPSPNPAQYTELLKAAYPVLKAADPDAVIVAGGLAAGYDMGSLGINPVRFVQEMYAAGAAGYFDALSYHPYHYTLKFSEGLTRTGTPGDQVKQIYALMKANGDGNKKIWATEYGQPSSTISEASQAEYIADFLRTWRSLEFAGPAFIHTVRDVSDNNAETASLGLFHTDWSAKAAVGLVTTIVNENKLITGQTQV